MFERFVERGGAARHVERHRKLGALLIWEQQQLAEEGRRGLKLRGFLPQHAAHYIAEHVADVKMFPVVLRH